MSGFLGKVLIGEAAISTGSYVLLGVSFFSGLVVLYSLLRIFMSCFWGETIMSEEEEKPLPKTLLVPGATLVLLTVAVGLGAEALAPYVKDATATLMNPEIYIDAVLSE